MSYTKKIFLTFASAVAIFFTTQFLAAQTGPTVFTPQLTVSPGFLRVLTGPTTVQDLTIQGTCTGCVGSGTFANPTGTVGLTAVNGVAATGIRSDGAPALSQAIAPTWTAVHTFNAIPAFNGGASGVTAPFTTDSNTVVTNLNADMLDGISSGSFARLTIANIFTVGQSITGVTEPNLTNCNTSAAANNQCTITSRIDGNGDYRFVLANDAGVGVTNVIEINRTGTTADSIALTATAATFNTLPIVTEEQGTFTVSFGNACATTPTITFDYTKARNTVTLEAVSTTGFTCTGDSTSFSSGADVPANLRPAVAANSAVYANGGFQDAGVVTAGCLLIDSSGLMFLSKFNGTVCNATGWTALGNRSATIQNINFTYMLGNP